MDVQKGDSIYIREVSGNLERHIPCVIKDIMGMGCKVELSRNKYRLVPWAHLGRSANGPWGKRAMYNGAGKKAGKKKHKGEVAQAQAPLPQITIAPPPVPDHPQSRLEAKVSELMGQDVKLDEEKGAYIWYSPELAAKLIEQSEKKNLRRVNENKVDQYVQAMMRDLWSPRISTPVVIGPEWYMINGQHRMWAVFKSGKTIKMYTVFQGTADELKELDGGYNRSLSLRLGLSNETTAALNAVRKYGSSNTKVTIGTSEQELYLKFYREDLEWYHNIPASTAGRKLSHKDALLRGVVIRARHHKVSSNMLMAFVQKLRRDPITSGVTLTEAQHSVVDKLAQYLDANPSSGEEVRKDKTQRIEWALLKFIANEAVVRLNANQNPVWDAPCGFDTEGKPLKGTRDDDKKPERAG